MKFKLDKSAQNLSPTHIAKQLEDQLFGFEHYQQQRKLGLYKSDWLEESIDFQDYNKLADDGDFNAR